MLLLLLSLITIKLFTCAGFTSLSGVPMEWITAVLRPVCWCVVRSMGSCISGIRLRSSRTTMIRSFTSSPNTQAPLSLLISIHFRFYASTFAWILNLAEFVLAYCWQYYVVSVKEKHSLSLHVILKYYYYYWGLCICFFSRSFPR